MTTALEVPKALPPIPTEESFFGAHTEKLHELFVVLDREAEWRDNPESLLAYTQAQWVGLEHGNSAEKDQFTPEQAAAAIELMKPLGLQAEIVPPKGHYEQAVILGGLTRVDRERIKKIKQLIDTGGVEIGQIVFLAGQRLRDARDDAQLNAMDLEALSTQDVWLRTELTRPTAAGWGNRLATETSLSRLAYLESFSQVKLHRLSTEMQLKTVEGVPRRGPARYTFTSEGYPDFVLMNCAAIERPNGAPRPTIESQVPEWLKKVSPSKAAKVLVVAGNPHILRNGRTIRQVAKQNGRADIDFTICGPAANPEASVQLYIGEIGRLLYMDVMAARASAAL